MYDVTMKNIIIDATPMIVIFCVILVTTRLIYLKNTHRRFVLWKEVSNLIFVVYLLLLFELVSNTESGSYGVNLIPFKEMFRYATDSLAFFYNTVGNMLIFIPFGFFISNYIEIKKTGQITLALLVISLSIESTQYFIGRAFDIDDIILNVLGGITGFLLYSLWRKIKKFLPKFMNSNWFNNIICVIFVVLAFLFFCDFFGWGFIK